MTTVKYTLYGKITFRYIWLVLKWPMEHPYMLVSNGRPFGPTHATRPRSTGARSL